MAWAWRLILAAAWSRRRTPGGLPGAGLLGAPRPLPDGLAGHVRHPPTGLLRRLRQGAGGALRPAGRVLADDPLGGAADSLPRLLGGLGQQPRRAPLLRLSHDSFLQNGGRN